MEYINNRILLIDDNPDNLELLSDLILHAFPGYTTLSARTALQGLDLAASADPDVILLDVVMPGMNGFEVCRKLKSLPQTSQIPVVFLTAIKSDREARLQALEVGAEAFLSRPVDEAELIATLRAMQKIKSAARMLQVEKESLTSLVAAQTLALQQTHTATLNLLDDLHAENEARKQNEAALRESEDKFRYMFEYSVAPKSITQLNGQLQVNQAFCEMLGYSQEELKTKTWQQITHPDDVEMNQKSLDSLISGEKVSLRLTKRYIHKHGSIVWVDFVSALRRDQEGRPLYLLSTFNDITELKQAQVLQQAVYQIAAAAETVRSLDELYPRIHQSISSVMPAENFFIALYDQARDLLHFPYFKDPQDDSFVGGVQPGKGTTAYVLRTGKSLLCTRQLHAELERQGEVVLLGVPSAIWLGVPLIVEGKTIGAMVVQHFTDPQAYGEREQHMLEFVSTQVAIAINRLQAEEALRKSESRFRAVVDNSHDGIVFTDAIGTILYRSPTYASINGYTPEERLGKNVFEFVHPDDLPGLHSLWEEMMAHPENPYRAQYRIQHEDGRWLWIESAGKNLLDNPDVQAVIISSHNITYRKEAEEALRASETRYRGLFENSPVALWEEDFSEVQRHIEKLRQTGVTDFRTFLATHHKELRKFLQEIKVLDVNAATLELMHAASKEQLIGNLDQVIKIKPDMDFVDELVNIAEGRSEFAWDGINYTLDGRKLFVSMHWSAAPGCEKTLEKVLVSIVDITERMQAEEAIRQLNASLEQRVEERTRDLRQAQEQLVRQEKLATLGQLAGGVGHELRNPLGVINSAVYYLKLVQPDADEKIKKYHLMIEQEVNTASRIINDLLDFGRIVSPDRQPVSIPDLLQHVLTRFPVPEAVQVQLKLPAGLPKVFADPLHLEQVLGNLTTNACQAMKDCADGGKLTISASLKKDQVAIAVRDTGTGISPEAMQRLFEPLFTTKLRGIGLGLAVSKKLAEANGGSITVRSTPGQGSTFTLYLPIKSS